LFYLNYKFELIGASLLALAKSIYSQDISSDVRKRFDTSDYPEKNNIESNKELVKKSNLDD